VETQKAAMLDELTRMMAMKIEGEDDDSAPSKGKPNSHLPLPPGQTMPTREQERTRRIIEEEGV
jgi:hypothetical protein